MSDLFLPPWRYDHHRLPGSSAQLARYAATVLRRPRPVPPELCRPPFRIRTDQSNSAITMKNFTRLHLPGHDIDRRLQKQGRSNKVVQDNSTPVVNTSGTKISFPLAESANFFQTEKISSSSLMANVTARGKYQPPWYGLDEGASGQYRPFSTILSFPATIPSFCSI